MQVPMLDLKAQYATIKQDVLQAVTDVLATQMVCNGPPVRQLEREVAEYCGVGSGVGVSSGTDALILALMGLEIGEGDEVITTPFTFFATAGSIYRVGAKPVFVDIEPDTFNISPAAIEAAVTPLTKAIMPVHLYGQMVEMDAIMAIAARNGLAVIEDAAQAIGATYKNKPAGSMGAAGCLSFYPTKNLGAMGDAGMVVTKDAALAKRLEMLRNHGQSDQYFHEWVGGNFRMDSIQAASLSVKMKRLEEWTNKRRANAARYDKLLAGLEQVVTPVVKPYCRHIYHQYVIRVARRDELKAFLQEHGVASGIYYPISLHEQPCFKSLGYRKGDMPVSERAAAEVLALPVYPEMTDDQAEHVVAMIKDFYTT